MAPSIAFLSHPSLPSPRTYHFFPPSMITLPPASADHDRRNEPPSALILNLPSNNPFRNPRTSSPTLNLPPFPSPQSAPVRPSSRNPFLAAFEQELDGPPHNTRGRSRSPLMAATGASDRASPQKPADNAAEAQDLLVSCTPGRDDRPRRKPYLLLKACLPFAARSKPAPPFLSPPSTLHRCFVDL